MFMDTLVWYWEFASKYSRMGRIEVKQGLIELLTVEAGDVYLELCYTFLSLLYAFEIFHNQKFEISFINMWTGCSSEGLIEQEEWRKRSVFKGGSWGETEMGEGRGRTGKNTHMKISWPISYWNSALKLVSVLMDLFWEQRLSRPRLGSWTTEITWFLC